MGDYLNDTDYSQSAFLGDYAPQRPSHSSTNYSQGPAISAEPCFAAGNPIIDGNMSDSGNGNQYQAQATRLRPRNHSDPNRGPYAGTLGGPPIFPNMGFGPTVYNTHQGDHDLSFGAPQEPRFVERDGPTTPTMTYPAPLTPVNQSQHGQTMAHELSSTR